MLPKGAACSPCPGTRWRGRPGRVFLAARRELFEPVLADRLQHQEARLAVRRPSSWRSRLLATTSDGASDPREGSGVRIAGRGPVCHPAPPATPRASSVQPPAKTASRRKRACSGRVQQVVAPGDGVAQRPLARRQVARAAGQQRQAARPAAPAAPAARSSLIRAAASSMASGSPSSRRQISATAGAFSSVSAKSAGPPAPARRTARRPRSAARADKADGGPGLGRVRQRQRRDRQLVLATDPRAPPGWSPGSSGPGRRASRSASQRRGRQHLLEVVEHQHEFAVAQGVGHRSPGRICAGFEHAERLGDRVHHQGGIGRVQPARRTRRHRRSDRSLWPASSMAQPGLASPGRSGERQVA